MKVKNKLIAVITLVLLLSGLVGCSSTDKPTNHNNNQNQEEVVDTPQNKDEIGNNNLSSNEDKTDITDKDDENNKADTEDKKDSQASNKDKTENPKKPAETPKKPDNKPSKPNNSKPEKPSQPDSGNNNDSTNNKPTTPPKEEKPSVPEKHTHIWKDVSSTEGDCSHKGKVIQECSCGEIRTVDGKFGDHNYKHMPAKTHTEYKTETYTEQVPKYKWIYWYECKKCHMKFDNVDECGDHCLYDCGGGYSVAEKKIQDGYETVTKEKKVPYEVVDDPAHDECSICGKRK